MKKIILILFTKLFFLNIGVGQEYNASLFGCVSDGIVNNTGSIQYAIDFISAKGGGKLNFYVGRYLTGSLDLKSNVTIELHEGAVFLASSNINDYEIINNEPTLLVADSASNVSLIGKGVIEMQSKSMINFMKKINDRGVLNYANDNLPNLITLVDSKNIKVDGILLLGGGNKAIRTINSDDVVFQNLIIKSKEVLSSGIFLENVKQVILQNIYVDVMNKTLVKLGDTQIIKIEKSITPNGKSIL